MSALSDLAGIVAQLHNASRRVVEIDALRAEHHADPAWNAMMDQATSALAEAVSRLEAFDQLETDVTRLRMKLEKAATNSPHSSMAD